LISRQHPTFIAYVVIISLVRDFRSCNKKKQMQRYLVAAQPTETPTLQTFLLSATSSRVGDQPGAFVGLKTLRRQPVRPLHIDS
jgi:hypothetical protein